MRLSTDVLGRSVRLRAGQVGRESVDMFREGAVHLHLNAEEPRITIDFRTADTTGRIEVRLSPYLQVKETSLLT